MTGSRKIGYQLVHVSGCIVEVRGYTQAAASWRSDDISLLQVAVQLQRFHATSMGDADNLGLLVAGARTQNFIAPMVQLRAKIIRQLLEIRRRSLNTSVAQ